jgi:hypothetical protein
MGMERSSGKTRQDEAWREWRSKVVAVLLDGTT